MQVASDRYSVREGRGAIELVYGKDKELCALASLGLFGCDDAFDDRCIAIGVSLDGKIIASIVYSDYQPDISVQMSIFSLDKRWATRYNLRQLFLYPFVQLRLKRVAAMCSAQNEGVIMFLKKLGFKHEGTHPAAHHDGGAALSFGMLKSDCRWI